MDTNTKIEVFNSLSLLNTVGQEIEYILDLHNKDKVAFLKFMNWPDFKSRTKLKVTELKQVNNYLSLDCSVIPFLKEFQNNYKEQSAKAIANFKKSKKEYKILKDAIPLLRNDFNQGIDLLDDLLDFFGCDDLDEIEKDKTYSCLFKENNHFSYNPINLHAWLRRGELDFKQNASSIVEYNKDLLRNWVEHGEEWKTHLPNLRYFLNLPKLFESFGICLSYTPYLPKTVYGAVQWIDKHPVIQISDNKKDLATGWMTLFHEIGHVILHENMSLVDAGEEADKKISNKQRKRMEVEANQFAANYLCNGNKLRTYIFNLARTGQYETLKSVSKKFGVNDIITAYWFRKAQYNPAYCQHAVIHLSFT